MIRTYRYVQHDGNKKVVDVPGKLVLAWNGPFIEPVTITHPRAVQERMEEEGKQVPAKTVRALIDTGASFSIIRPGIASELGLVHTGYQNITSVQDTQKQPVYYGTIIFPWGFGIDTSIVTCPLKKFDCLIGRDVLQFLYLTYNGPDGSIVICS